MPLRPIFRNLRVPKLQDQKMPTVHSQSIGELPTIFQQSFSELDMAMLTRRADEMQVRVH